MKNVLATVVGLILFFLIIGIGGVMSMVGMIAAGESTKNVAKNSVFVLNLSGQLEERSESKLMSMVTGQVSGTIGLDEVLSAIKKANRGDKIFITATVMMPDGKPKEAYAVYTIKK